MTEERIGLRIFSEGKELDLGVEEKSEQANRMWNHYTKCPHCKKEMRIIKWIEFRGLIKL